MRDLTNVELEDEIARLIREIAEKQHDIDVLQDQLDDLKVERFERLSAKQD